MKARLIFAFLIASMAPAAAAPLLIVGHGADSCAEYSQGRVIAPAVEESYLVWAQGFMSGVNTIFLSSKSATRNLGSMSDDDQKAALRNYCAAHPGDNFGAAVAKIFFTFPQVPPDK